MQRPAAADEPRRHERQQRRNGKRARGHQPAAAKSYEGTLQLMQRVHPRQRRLYHHRARTGTAMEVVLDEDVSSRRGRCARWAFARATSSASTRARASPSSGYIKSRFLDDKLSVGILLGLCEMYPKDEAAFRPSAASGRHITVYEEVGHGGSACCTRGRDRGHIGGYGLRGRRTWRVPSAWSPSAPRTAAVPYCYEVVLKLIDAAERAGADYAVDVYPHYGSDVEATLSAGYDVQPRPDRPGRLRQPRLRAQPPRRRGKHAEAAGRIYRLTAPAHIASLLAYC